jgi:preprotein translocase subunit SecB
MGILARVLVSVADALTRATLPVVHLPEVNWHALWQQQSAQAPAPADGAETLAHKPAPGPMLH